MPIIWQNTMDAFSSIDKNLIEVAEIFEFSKEYGICKTDYKNTEHYKITKSFLNNPEKMLEYLLK